MGRRCCWGRGGIKVLWRAADVGGVFFLISIGMCIRRGNQPAEYKIDVRRLGAPTKF